MAAFLDSFTANGINDNVRIAMCGKLAFFGVQLNINKQSLRASALKQERNSNQKQSVGNIHTGKKILDVYKDLLFGGNNNESTSNYSQEDNSVKNYQIINIHNLPFLAKYNVSQVLKINPANPNTTTTQFILSTENTGIIIDATDTIAKLPNKLDKALDSDWVRFINLVWNKNSSFVKSSMNLVN